MKSYAGLRPGKANKASAPKVASPAESMCQGSRPRRGAPPTSPAASMRQGNRPQRGGIAPCRVPSVRQSLHQ